MTDPIAEGVKLEDAIVILREGLRSDRPLTLKERLLIGKIIDERAALTAAGEMAGERQKALEDAAMVAQMHRCYGAAAINAFEIAQKIRALDRPNNTSPEHDPLGIFES